MFKKKKEEPHPFILPEVFHEIKIDPYQRASSQTLNLATFLLRDVDRLNHKVVIESDNKVVEIIVSVETHKTAEDG